MLLPLALSAQVLDTVIKFSGWPGANMLYVPDGNKLYVRVNGLDDSMRQIASLYVLDCSTWAKRKVCDIASPGGEGEDGPAWNWRRNKVYYGTVTGRGGNPGTLVIDNVHDSLLKSIGPMHAWRPAYDSRDDKIYTVSGLTVSVIDCAADSIIKVISQPYQMNGFTVWDSVNDRVYVGCSWDQYVTVIDCTTDSVISAIPTGTTGPAAASFYYERNKVYVPAFWSGGSAVIDTKLLTMLRRLPYSTENDGPEQPFVPDPEDDKCYCPVRTDGAGYGDTLKVLRGGDDSTIKMMPLFGECMAIAHVPWSDRLYVAAWVDADTSTNLLQVIDCRTDSVVGRYWFRSGLKRGLQSLHPRSLHFRLVRLGGLRLQGYHCERDCRAADCVPSEAQPVGLAERPQP